MQDFSQAEAAYPSLDLAAFKAYVAKRIESQQARGVPRRRGGKALGIALFNNQFVEGKKGFIAALDDVDLIIQGIKQPMRLFVKPRRWLKR